MPLIKRFLLTSIKKKSKAPIDYNKRYLIEHERYQDRILFEERSSNVSDRLNSFFVFYKKELFF